MDRRRLKRRLFLWRLLSLLALVVLGTVITAKFVELPKRDHVSRIEISGIITEDLRLTKALESIRKDKRSKALLVHINSPGGTTYGSERLFKGLRRVAEEKPVVAVIGTLGASGGYLAALGSDRIFAGESSITGSIGVLFQTAEFSALMEKIGIKAEAITSGPLKGEPLPFKPMSPQVRRAAQALVDDSHKWFVDLVAERRPLERDAAARLADGRVYTGVQALDNKLVDELGDELEARKWLETAHGIDSKLPMVKVSYTEPETVLERFGLGLGQALAGKTFLAERLTLDGLVSLWHPE